MLLFVICFNLSLTLLNLYLVLRLLRLRQYLKCTTKRLIRLEKCSHRLLAPLSPNLNQAKQGTIQFRKSYQKLGRQLILLQGLLQSLQVINLIWKRRKWGSHSA
jgi:hypothetical protein